MRSLVLERAPESAYGDTPTSYEFPARYLGLFSPLSHGEHIFAVIYEPRGRNGLGRMKYVGYALITEPPEKDPTSGRWRATYAERMFEFEHPVPRALNGQPVESWLRDIPQGRTRNVQTFGRAVRPLADEDLALILQLGRGDEMISVLVDEYQSGPGSTDTAILSERTRRLVEVASRTGRFRELILPAYQWRCAVTGLATENLGAGRSYPLLDAAHIRPVGDSGSDSPSNGLALTPTVHRMFDLGLFTLRTRDDALVVQVSPQLRPSMLLSPGGQSQLRIEDGLRVYIPTTSALRPSDDALAYHQAKVFLSASP
jgi:putative restriction endonuclease